MTKPRHFLNLFAAALCLGALLTTTATARADDAIDEDLVWKIGQIVLDTAAGHSVEGGPTQQQVDRFRQMGANSVGPSWGIKKRIESSAVDGKKVDLIYNVTILPEGHAMTAAQKANWEKYGLPADQYSGALIAFRTIQEGDVRRHRTIYSLESGGYRLFMMVGREGDETADEAVKKTLPAFHKFFDNAVRLGLFEATDKIFVTLLPADNTDHQGNMAPGQVVHVSKQQTKLHFKVHAEAAHYEKDKPYVLAIDVKTPKGHAPMKVHDGRGNALPDADGDGVYELHIDAPGAKHAGDVVVETDKTLVKKSDQGSYAAGPAVVLRARTTKIDDEGNITIAPDGQNFGVQASTWYPIVTRMEVFHLSQKIEGTGKTDAELTPMFSNFSGTFSTLAGAVASLDETFKEHIVPIAQRADQIGDHEPVMLGWRLHPSNPDYVLIQMDQEGEDFQTRAVAIPQKSKPFFAVWMDVVSPSAKGEDANVETETWGDFGGGMDTQGGSNGDPSVDMNRHTEEFEREIMLDTSYDDGNGIWVNRIAYIPQDKTWQNKTEMVADLRKMLRMPVGGPAAKNPNDADDPISYKLNFLQLKRGFTRYTDMKESMLTTDPVPVPQLAEQPGVYEIRFKARPYNTNEGLPQSEDYDKKIDVAIRYAVIPTQFHVRLLEWDQQRAR